jgi:hypothetical protein
MKRTIIAALLLSLGLAGCKCTRDSGESAGDAESTETADTLSEEERARLEAEREAKRKLRNEQCDQLVDRAWTKASSTLRTLGVSVGEEVETEYREATVQMRERCVELTDEQMGCVRSAQDVIFGLLSCNVAIEKGEDVAVVTAPEIAEWVRQSLRARLANSQWASSLTELPVGNWELKEDSQETAIIQADGTFIAASPGAERRQGTAEVIERGLMKVEVGDETQRLAFHPRNGELSTLRGTDVIAVPAEAEGDVIVDLGADFAIFEQNERTACKVFHRTGATSEGECRVMESDDGKQVVFRYRFPMASGEERSPAEEVTVHWLGDTLLRADAKHWVEQE